MYIYIYIYIYIYRIYGHTHSRQKITTVVGIPTCAPAPGSRASTVRPRTTSGRFGTAAGRPAGGRCEKSTPPEKRTCGEMSFQSVKSGAGG